MDNIEHSDFGGRTVPEPLENALEQLRTEFESLKDDAAFQEQFQDLLETYVGRPSPLYYAKNLSSAYGADIYLKREDLNHGGAHKINNCLGQGLLAEFTGKNRLIAETGAGQHGVATAMVGALLNLETEIYMGAKDAKRQSMNVARMRLLGATVTEVTQGDAGLADAVDVALEDFARNIDTTHYLVGSAVGPDPYPRMVKEFQSVIGTEAREQIRDQTGALPDACVACVGGGSNAIGLFSAFDDDAVEFYGAEGAGDGVNSDQHAAPLSSDGDVTQLHGMTTKVISDDVEVHSVSPGLDYPGVGPEHAALQELGRAEYHGITDEEALHAFQELSELEGIIPALESSHGVALAKQLAEDNNNLDTILINLSGRGDKDMDIAIQELSLQ